MIEHKISHQDKDTRSLQLTAYRHAEDVPMDDARALLMSHVTWAYGKFRDLGAPEVDILSHVEAFFGHLDDVLPPRGAFYLAHDSKGRAVGTAALRRESDTTAEMKHLYVSPDTRGTGLGEALIVARIEAARGLGIKTLLADTFQGNTAMIRLYQRLGFAASEPYDSMVTRVTPGLVPHLRYFRMEL